VKRGQERPQEYVDDVKLIEYTKFITVYTKVQEEAPGSYDPL
jgi:hypothetical protein